MLATGGQRDDVVYMQRTWSATEFTDAFPQNLGEGGRLLWIALCGVGLAGAPKCLSICISRPIFSAIARKP